MSKPPEKSSVGSVRSPLAPKACGWSHCPPHGSGRIVRRYSVAEPGSPAHACGHADDEPDLYILRPQDRDDGSSNPVRSCSLDNPFRTELTKVDYARVRALGDEYVSRNSRSIA